MNTEIKFEYGFESINGIIKKVYNLDEIPYIQCKCDTFNIAPIKYVRQYTGLKDKNGKGKDVFVGDLFEVIYSNCPNGYSIIGREKTIIKIIGVVVFKYGMFCIKVMHPDYNEIVHTPLYDFLKNEEKAVVGNIYENIELLQL